MVKTQTFNEVSYLSETANISGDEGRDKVIGQAAPAVEIQVPGVGEIVTISLSKGELVKLSFEPSIATPVIDGDDFVLTFDLNGDGSADSRIVFQNLVQNSQGADAPILVIGGIEYSTGLLIGQAQALIEGQTLETAAGGNSGPVGGGGSTYSDDFGATLASLIAQGRLASSTERLSEEGLLLRENDIVFNPVPAAFDDIDSVLEDSSLPATGNVVTGIDSASGDINTTDGEADILGGDGFGGISWANATGGTMVVGLYGTLTVGDDGSYSYQLDDNNSLVDGLNIGDSLIEEFSYTIRDGSGDTAIAKLSLTINGSNDAPVVSDASSVPISYIEDDPASIVFADINVSDVDNATLSSAVVTITDLVAGDELGLTAGYSLPLGMTMTWDTATGTLTLSGGASLSGYEDALEHITYRSSSDNPDDYGASPTRTITVKTNDGQDNSNVISKDIAVIDVNDAPVLTEKALLSEEIRVNTETSYDQNDPSVTNLSGGGWVVTWTSYAQDGSGHGVFGQAYSADGSKEGSEFQINTETYAPQLSSSVSALPDGGWVVVWESMTDFNSFTFDIMGQAYNADGTKQDGEFQVNTHITGDQTEPSVSGLSDGGWIVTWMSDGQDGSGYGVYAQAFDSNGAPKGIEFQVSTEIQGSQSLPTVIGLATGGWIITWTDQGSGSSAEDVYARVYTAAGEPQGQEFLVNSETDNVQSSPAVTSLADGGWVVTWESSGQDGDGTGIYGQAYNADGTKQGSEFQVNSITDGSQLVPSVTGLSDGGWVVTWHSVGIDGYSVYGQAYNVDGTKQGGEFQVNSFSNGSQLNSSVTGLADGGWVVTWQSDGQDSSGSGIYSKTFNSDGSVRSYYDPGTGLQYYAYSEDGAALVVFPDLTLRDVDDTSLSSATVSITDFVAGDVLGLTVGYSLPVGITMSYDPATGVFRLTGAASLADYEAALEHVAYSSTSDNPDGFGQNLTRTLEVTVNDAQDNSNVISKTITVIDTNDAPVLADATVFTEETRINTETDSWQLDPSVTGLADGGWAVTWESWGQDGSDWGIYCQAYNADGSVQGGEFRINTETDDTQSDPSVTGLADGGWVVTWHSDGQDGSSSGIYGQAYNADGSVQGEEFCINTETYSSQILSSVTGLADGGWVVTWQSSNQDGSGSGIYGQAYNADGSVQGEEFRINTETVGHQRYPSVTSLVDGGWVVAWESDGQDGSYYGIYGQAYNADGSVQGGEFRINIETVGHQSNPSVTGLTDGGWVVTWQSFEQDGSEYGIYGQAYNAGGSVKGGEFRINIETVGHQSNPSVTGLTDGGWVVTWQSFEQDGSKYGIYGQAYNVDGSVQGDEFRINTETDNFQINPSITGLADGGWVVTWESDGQDGSGYGIYSKTFNSDGSVRSYYDPGTGLQYYAYTEGGEPLVVFADLGISDVDDATLSSAVITITDFVAGDELGLTVGYSLPAGITMSWDTATGTLILSGGTSLSDYEDALEHITYRSISDNPDLYGTDTTRIITVQINDGQDNSNVISKNVAVIGINDAPVVSDDSSVPIAYNEGDPASIVFADLGISDADSTSLSSAVVTITDFVSGDELGLTAGYSLPVGMSMIWDAATGTLSLSGAASSSDYEDALEHITYRSSSDNPDNYGANPTRTITVKTNDGQDNSDAISKTISVHDTNDVPIITDLSSSVDVTQSSTGQLLSIFGYETVSSVTALSNGGWVVIWGKAPLNVRFRGSDSEIDILGQVYNADGSKQGTEIQINNETIGGGSNPLVTGLADGGWVVTWTRDNGTFGQVFNVDGTKRGNELSIFSDTEGASKFSAVTSLADGGWVVTWDVLPTGGPDFFKYKVLGQRFSANGETLGEEFVVYDPGPFYFRDANPSISSLENGGWVITWMTLAENTVDDHFQNKYEVYGQAFNPDGSKAGGQFHINTHVEDNQLRPSITALSDGGWVVTWSSNDQDGEEYGIYGQAYHADGTKQGGEFQVNTVFYGSEDNSQVTALEDGGWVVTWVIDVTFLHRMYSQISAQIFNSDGSRRGEEFPVEGDLGSFQTNPSVSGLPDGGWVVSWASRAGPGGGITKIYSKTFNSDGSMRSYYDSETGQKHYAYTQDGDQLVVFADLSLSDVDDLTLSSATVSVSDFVIGDVLGLVTGYSLPTGLSMNWDPTTGVLILSGAGSLADYEAALENVGFSSTSNNPVLGGLNSTRTVNVQVNDGQDDSAVISKTFSVINTAVGTVVTGTSGDEALTGTVLDDLIEGNGGIDTLTGGTGSDIFHFKAGENGDDTITDFSLAQGDILHIGNLLIGEEAGDLENYLSFTENGGNTIISIDTNGDGSGTDQTITLTGVDLTNGGTLTTDLDVITDLLNHNALIVDQ
ncbi:MAG: type I secretion C-terminal target domain-containing protein [Halopseudomonas aestusnigri]